MAFLPGVRLNASPELLSIASFKDFSDVLNAGLEELSNRAPSDTILGVDILRQRGEYKIVIRLVSQVLEFFETGVGRSPYVALEKVLLKACDRLKVWSIKKTV